MEYTKEPWKQRGDDSVCVVDANGNAICYADTFLPKEQCIANARLIAAAPELLATLEDILGNLNMARLLMDKTSRDLAGEVIEEAKKLISKAEGRS
jgi:hypothetical protein